MLEGEQQGCAEQDVFIAYGCFSEKEVQGDGACGVFWQQVVYRWVGRWRLHCTAVRASAGQVAVLEGPVRGSGQQISLWAVWHGMCASAKLPGWYLVSTPTCSEHWDRDVDSRCAVWSDAGGRWCPGVTHSADPVADIVAVPGQSYTHGHLLAGSKRLWAFITQSRTSGRHKLLCYLVAV